MVLGAAGHVLAQRVDHSRRNHRAIVHRDEVAAVILVCEVDEPALPSSGLQLRFDTYFEPEARGGQREPSGDGLELLDVQVLQYGQTRGCPGKMLWGSGELGAGRRLFAQ